MPQRVTPEIALAQITAPAARGDGWRHLFLGNSGMGKTWANKRLIDYALKQGAANLVLTLDDKTNRKAQYEGTYRINPAHLLREPPKKGESFSHIVFRGVALSRRFDNGCSAEQVAQCAQGVSEASSGIVLANIDELADATNGGQAWKRGEDGGESRIAQIYRKGRGMGIAISATTQIPQSLPREAFSLSDTIGIFRLTGREIDYLLSKRAITPELAAIIPTLGIGDWVLYDKSREGEGHDKIFRFNR